MSPRKKGVRGGNMVSPAVDLELGTRFLLHVVRTLEV
jgi:hypothetical protein